MSKPELAQYAKADGTGRAYKHPFRKTPEGKPLTSPSVTTILNLVDKSALIQWAVNLTMDWAVENASALLSKSDEDAKRWGKYRWKDTRDERAEVGTGIHETIEALHTGTWNFPPLDEEQQAIMEQWHILNERYEFTPHKSEFTVWGFPDMHEFSYAGTADGLWDILDRETGEFYSNMYVDLKTSKNTWPEHWLQLAALRTGQVIMVKGEDGTWSEEAPPQSDGTAIIHLRADKATVIVETDERMLELQHNQFMSYRAVWAFGKEIDALRTQREKDKVLAF